MRNFEDGIDDFRSICATATVAQQIYRFLDRRFLDALRGRTLPEHIIQGIG